MNQRQADRALKLAIAGQLLTGSRPAFNLSHADEERMDAAAAAFGQRILREIGHYAQIALTTEDAVRMALEQIP